MLYQLLCLARPMAAQEVGSMIHGIGRVVYSTGGVVCDVKSYGRQYLAYRIRGVKGKYDQANIWELEFAVSPEALRQINHELRVNEDVLRYVVLRRDGVPKLPDPRTMFHRNEKFGHLLRSPPLPGAVPIPLGQDGGAAAAAAAVAAAGGRQP